MPDRGFAREFFIEQALVKDLADDAHRVVAAEGRAVARGDACGFLPAVLLRKEAEIGDLRGLARPPYAKQAALFLFFVVVVIGSGQYVELHGTIIGDRSASTNLTRRIDGMIPR